MPAWDSIPAAQRPFQLRLIEIYAGFVEHVDAQVGKVIDELERLGVRDNTIVIYIFGDNGASAQGQNGTISELLAQNGIPNTVEQQMAALNTMGGLDLLGGPKTDSWQFDATTTRMPEFTAPGLGRRAAPSALMQMSRRTVPECCMPLGDRGAASASTWTKANSSTSTT